MRIDTVRVKYSVPKTTPIGHFDAGLSPDGWENTRYQPTMDDHLRSDEVKEFTDLVKSFFHDFPTQNELKKYCKKHGTETDAVTYSFRFDCALMIYIVHVSGYSATFVPYRKENA